jgi:hypothetical protein
LIVMMGYDEVVFFLLNESNKTITIITACST